MTLRMIRELVGEGLFVLGNLASSKTHTTGFIRCDLPSTKPSKIEAADIDNYDDRCSWDSMMWMNHTRKGEKLALEIYRQDFEKDRSGAAGNHASTNPVLQSKRDRMGEIRDVTTMGAYGAAAKCIGG